MIRQPIRLTLGAAAVTGLLVAGTGAAYGTAAAGAAPMHSKSSGQVLHVTAASNGRLRFNMPKLTASKPGKITIRMTNPKNSKLSHGIAVEGHGVDKDGKIVRPGKTTSVTVTLKKGKYTYYCPVPGHKQAGMKGTLTVR